MMYMKNKLKEKLKNNKKSILSFILAFIIINIVFYINEITPYGEHTTLKVDFFHQYGPMLKELWYRVTHFKSLFYSYNMSMGLPIFRNFFNYLASPFNIILLFFTEKTIITGYSFVIMLRVSTCAATFNYFLEQKFKDKKSIYIFLSLLYAFSNYFVSYYWNIMWLDGMVFLPLIVLGIEKIINENKYLLYIISLTITIISNYYIGYTCCIYSAIYFIFYLIYKTEFKSLKNKKYLKSTFKKVLIFTLSSISVGLLISFFALPLLKSLSTISATNDVWPTSQYYNFSFLEFIVNHLSCIETVTFKTDPTNAPNISCGIISVFLLLLFIFNNKIKLKTKIIYMLILISVALCFFIPGLDFILHALHVPNDLPYRYSFLYSFTLMIILAYSLKNIQKLHPVIVIVTYILLSLMIFTFKLLDLNIVTNKVLIINLILISIYLILYLIMYYDKKTIKYLEYAIILVSGVEIVCNVNYNWIHTDDIKDKYEYYDEIKKTVNKLDELEDNSFYRIEKTFSTTLNDSSWYNYNGITTFSSMEYERMAILHHNLGTNSNLINSYEYIFNTPIYDLMFDLKYILGYIYDKDNYKEIYENDKYNTYKTNHNSNLLYAVNNNIKDYTLEIDNPILNQSNFIYLSTGINNIFDKLNYKNRKIIDVTNGLSLIEYTYDNNYLNNYFYNNCNAEFYIINGTLYYKEDEILKYISPEYYSSTNQLDENILINFINDKDEFKILVGSYYNDNDIGIYSVNSNKLKVANNLLMQEKVKIESFKDTYIKASVNVNDDKTIYTSIPYDDEFKVYIDGVKVDTFMIADSLLGFDIKSGNHTIEIKYQNNLMIVGSVISITTLLVILYIQKRKRK